MAINKIGIKNKSATQNAMASLSVSAYVAYLSAIISIIYKSAIVQTKESIYFEVILLVLMTLSIFIHRLITKQFNFPVEIFGKKKSSVHERPLSDRVRHYLMDSIGFSIVYVIFKHLIMKTEYNYILVSDQKIIQMIFELLPSTIFIFIVDFLWFESNIYLSNRKNK